MIDEGTHENALTHLVQLNAVREFIVGRDASGTKWTVSVRMGDDRRRSPTTSASWVLPSNCEPPRRPSFYRLVHGFAVLTTPD